jgi:uncharacterized pyridoxamine 5'-phosphate oxidase family protein
MENQNEYLSFLKENPVCSFATSDGNKPFVRPVQLMFVNQGKLYFCTANSKNMYKQMQANPNIELSTSSKDYLTTLRISGKVTFSKDLSLKQKIIAENALVRSIYKTADNPILEVFYVEHGNAKLQYLNGKSAKTTDF